MTRANMHSPLPTVKHKHIQIHHHTQYAKQTKQIAAQGYTVQDNTLVIVLLPWFALTVVAKNWPLLERNPATTRNMEAEHLRS